MGGIGEAGGRIDRMFGCRAVELGVEGGETKGRWGRQAGRGRVRIVWARE